MTGRDLVQPLTDRGAPAGAPVQVTHGPRDAYEVDLLLVDGAPLVAWYEVARENRASSAFLAQLDAAGAVVWRRPLGAEDAQTRNPVVRLLSDGAIAAAWIGPSPEDLDAQPWVWTQRFAPDGAPLAAALPAWGADVLTWNLNAAVDGADRFFVVYDAALGARAHELQMLTIDGEEISHRPLTPDDGFASLYPDLAINADEMAALAWFDERDGNQEVYLSVAPLAALEAGAPADSRRVTDTPPPSIGTYLAWSTGRLALAWCDQQDGQQELYAQTFDLNGAPLSWIERLTSTPTQSSIPAIRPWKDGFVIAWNEYAVSDVRTGHAAISSSEAMSLGVR
jgi:hypothetical protein